MQLVNHIAELSSPSGVIPLWLVEKKAIEAVTVFCDGNIPKAAALLDVSLSTIYRKKQI
ncbi:MAG: helix-turn-helix domain-containing protein [Methylococcales bacterium]|nr:helix-turn-helix domain-containing protein [Methylococcales bacterium]